MISSYRDPLDRCISHVFQGIYGLIYKKHKNVLTDFTFDVCYERLVQKINYFFNAIHSIEEIDPNFFSKNSFSHQSKSCYVKDENFEYLVFVLEHSDRWKEIIESKLGFEDVQIERQNVTAKKDQISRLYEDFKKNLKLPRDLIYEIYFGDNRQSSHLRWFYTNDEINHFYERALNNYLK